MGHRRRGLLCPQGRARELRHRDGGARQHRAWPVAPSTSVALRPQGSAPVPPGALLRLRPHPDMPVSLRRPAPGPHPRSPVTVKLPGHARPRPHHPMQPHLLGPFPAVDATHECPERTRPSRCVCHCHVPPGTPRRSRVAADTMAQPPGLPPGAAAGRAHRAALVTGPEPNLDVGTETTREPRQQLVWACAPDSFFLKNLPTQIKAVCLHRGQGKPPFGPRITPAWAARGVRPGGVHGLRLYTDTPSARW